MVLGVVLYLGGMGEAFGQNPAVLTTGTSFTVPTNTKAMKVEAWGGGGAGGNNRGGGGGGGAYARSSIVGPFSASYPYTIGAGGNNSNGGITSFGAGPVLVSASGGVRGGDGGAFGQGGSVTIGNEFTQLGGNGAGRSGNAGGDGGNSPNGGNGGPGGASGIDGTAGSPPGGGGGGGGQGNNGANGGLGRIRVSYIQLTSATNTDSQSVCSGGALTAITYSVPTGSTVTIPALPSSGVSFSYNSGSGTITISGTPTASISTYTINVTTSYGVTLSTTGTITFNPTPTLSSTLTPAAICSNTAFTYTPTSATTGATFTWTRAAVTGISNAAVTTAQSSNPNETLVNTTANPVNVVYAYTITANGCSNTQNVTVTVNPTPTLSSTLTPAAICSNTAFTYTPTSATTGATFTWTRAAVTGISNAAVTTAQSSNPNETLVNTTANPVNVVYAYTITANGCSNTQNVTVTVNPTPTLSSTLTPAAICSNTAFTYTPTSATTGATFTWTRAAVTGISNAAVTTAQSSNPNETLVNTTANPVNVVYAYTITANGCSNTQNVTVTVNPTPTLSSTLTPAAICSNTAFTYTPTSATTGATFTWTRAAVTGISNAAVTTAQSSNPNETLVNTTANPVNVVYAYTITANGCSNTQNVTVAVNPTPTLSSSLTPAAICTNTSFTYTPTSATTGAVFTWTRAAVTGISNAAVTTAQSSNPNETLVNTTANPVNVVYAYTITANGCSNTQNVTVAVNPTPTLSSSLTPAAICTNTSFTYTPTSATTGAVFTWTRAAVTGISNAAVTTAQSSNPNETLVNTTANPLNVVYAYTITANGCSNTQNVTVAVNPTPTLSSTLAPTAICSNSAFTYTPTSATSGATFTWTRAAVTGISNPAVTTPQASNPNETLINTTANPVNVVYAYTITANGCSNTQNVTVTVNPTPTLSSTLTPAAICSNSAFTYTPTSATAGATFTWTRAAVTGISNPAVTTPQASNPNETLINTTANPVNVVYAYTITANGCSNTQNVTVTVNPTPTLSSSLILESCNNASFTYTPTSATAGATFTWTRAAVTGISNPAVTTPQASNPNETLINTTGNPVNVVYAYTITANGCSNTQNVTVTVNPITSITNQPDNTGDSVCFGDGFSPISVSAVGGNLTYQWYRNPLNSNSGGISVPGATSASFTPPSTPEGSMYYYVVVTGACGSETSNVSGLYFVAPPITTITQNPPTTAQTVCLNGTFSPISFTATGAGTMSYQWYSNTTNTNSGGTLILGATNSSYTPPATTVGTTYYYATAKSDCGTVPTAVSGAFTVTPLTEITAEDLDGEVICDGDTFDPISVTSIGTGTINYQWYRNTTNSTSGPNVTAVGTDSNSYTPLADAIGTFYYFVTVSSDCGPDQTSTVFEAFTVNPIPTVTNTVLTETICSGESTTQVDLTSAVAGTTFAWTATATSGVSGFSASGSGPIPTQTISNTGTTQGTVTYVITPTATGCPGPTTNYTVLVDPIPTVTNTSLTQTICSGENTSQVDLTSAVAGTTFAWTATATPGVTGFSASGSGPIPTQTISNTGTTQGTVTYVITPTATGCPGPTTNYTVLVDPIPTVTNTSLTQTICSGENTSQVDLTSAVAGTTFAWTATATSGVSGFTANGSGPIPIQTIANSGTTQGTVTYVITPAANGCPGPTTTYTVLVDPIPTVTNTTLTQTICSGESTTQVDLTSSVAGTTFAWSATATSGVSGFTASGTGPIPAQTISTTASSQGTVTYVITPTATGCPGPTINYTVLVDPLPTVTNTSLTQTICSGESTTAVPLTSDVAGTTFAWTATATAGVSGFTASGTGPIAAQTISTTATSQGTVTYVITPTANGCPGPTTNYTVLVDPLATVGPTSNPYPSICIISPVLSPFTQPTTGVTDIGVPTGLPPGITAIFNSGTGNIEFSGTATTTGFYSYSIPLIGNCINGLAATGTIDVTPIYELTSVSSVSASIVGGSANVTINGNPANLPNGLYEVTYILDDGINPPQEYTSSSFQVTNGRGTFSTIPLTDEDVDVYELTIKNIGKVTDPCDPTELDINDPINTTYFSVCGAPFTTNGTFYVPAGIYEVTIQAFGAGASGEDELITIPVTPGEPLGVFVGQNNGSAVPNGRNTYVTRDSSLPNPSTSSLIYASGGGGAGDNGLVLISYSCPDANSFDCIEVIDDGAVSGTAVIEFLCDVENWAAPDGLTEFFVWAGGGGGGGGMGNAGGGGGAGGINQITVNVSNPYGLPSGTTFDINLGEGGNGASTTSERGLDGVSSIVSGIIDGSPFNLTAIGGGGGGSDLDNNGGDGGSGGGAAAFRDGNITGKGTAGEGSQGRDGGEANVLDKGQQLAIAGGGGGGALDPGKPRNKDGNANGNGTAFGGDGGDSQAINLANNNFTFYYGAGGGGSGTNFNGTEKPGSGGLILSLDSIIGGNGNTEGIGGNGVDRTGSGGGAGLTRGGRGGSGRVFITYPIFRILPVEFLYFNASYNIDDRSGILTWATAKEWENSHFEIERSINDTRNWTKVGEVSGQGYSDIAVEYSFTDPNLPSSGGNIFYRLKQVDLKGDFAYSVTRAIQVEGLDGSTSWIAYPNPSAMRSSISVDLLDRSGYTDEAILIRISDPRGVFESYSVSSPDEVSAVVNSYLDQARPGLHILQLIWGNKSEQLKLIRK